MGSRSAFPLWLALAVGLLMPLAGCTSSSDSSPSTDPGVVVVDSPFNKTLAGDARPHLHDYWGGKHRLTIADVDVTAGGILWLGPTPIAVASHRPEPGQVVPQGAGWVNVTVGWTDDPQAFPPNTYTNPQLWVKSASDNNVTFRANLTQNPQTVAIPIGAGQADLPHQVLSAWQFDLLLHPTWQAQGTPAERPELAFSGTTHFLVTADRTRDIPLYPGHPDQWQNRTEILLTQGGGDLMYDGNPATGNWRCYGACPVIHHPDDKVVVPATAASVVVKLGLSGTSPTKLGLQYHDASSRDWVKLTPTEDTATLRTYVIPVGQGGDGPYATQSQWEFAPYPEGPVEEGFMRETYTFEAVAKKGI